MEPEKSPDFVLSLEDLLGLALHWELKPDLSSDILVKGEDKIPVSRNQIIGEIKRIPAFANRDDNFFAHANGWQEVRLVILGLLDGQLKNSQPDPAKLKDLEEAKEAVTEDRESTTHRQRRWQDYYNSWKKQLGEREEIDSHEASARLADQFNGEEITATQEPDTGVPTTGQRVLRITARETVAETATVPRPVHRFVPTGEIRSLRGQFSDFLRHPQDTFRQLFAKPQMAAGADGAKIAAQKAAGTAVKSAAAGAAKGVATKGLLTALPTGVTQVAAVALAVKDTLGKIIPKELQEKIKDLASKLKIGLKALMVWLMMNPGALLGAMVGAAMGGVFGIAGVTAGFAAGMFLGMQLQGIVGSMLGGGTAAGIGGMGAGTVGGVGGAVAPATISVGGFTIPSSVASAASSIGGMFASTSVYAFAGIGITGSLLALITSGVMAIAALQTQEGNPGNVDPNARDEQNTGRLISVVNEVDKSSVAEGAGQTLTYTITLTSLADADLNLSLSMTQVKQGAGGASNVTNPALDSAAPSTLAAGQSVVLSTVPYQLNGSFNNSSLTNTVFVTATLASDSTKTETQSDSVTTMIGTVAYTGVCQLAPEGNACSVTNLLPYFDNDQVAAGKASRICFRESGGNVNDLNDACAKNLSLDKMREYSVGIFQVNLWAHSNLCTQVLDGKNPFYKPYYAHCTYPDCNPCERDENLLQQCRNYWSQPENNISYAVSLSKHGTSWKAWSTAAPPSSTCNACCNIP